MELGRRELRDLRREVDELELEFGGNDGRVGDALITLGVAMYYRGEGDESVNVLSRAVRVQEVARGLNHAKVGVALMSLADALFYTGRAREAVRVLRRAVVVREAAHGPSEDKLAVAYYNLGNALESVDQLYDAVSSFCRALTIFSAAVGSDHHATLQTRSRLRKLCDRLARVSSTPSSFTLSHLLTPCVSGCIFVISGFIPLSGSVLAFC